MVTSKTAVVIPAYKVADVIADVVHSIPPMIDHIIIVDDKCPQGSGKVAEAITDLRIIVIYHEHNQGVGGAVISGYRKAMDLVKSKAVFLRRELAYPVGGFRITGWSSSIGR